MNAAMDINISLHSSIDEIDEQTWNQVAPKDTPIASHKFVRLCELSEIG